MISQKFTIWWSFNLRQPVHPDGSFQRLDLHFTELWSRQNISWLVDIPNTPLNYGTVVVDSILLIMVVMVKYVGWSYSENYGNYNRWFSLLFFSLELPLCFSEFFRVLRPTSVMHLIYTTYQRRLFFLQCSRVWDNTRGFSVCLATNTNCHNTRLHITPVSRGQVSA